MPDIVRDVAWTALCLAAGWLLTARLNGRIVKDALRRGEQVREMSREILSLDRRTRPTPAREGTGTEGPGPGGPPPKT